jgi:hypothetical protein
MYLIMALLGKIHSLLVLIPSKLAVWKRGQSQEMMPLGYPYDVGDTDK